ncbi:DUF5050 domain-containing protein [Methylophilaceae bacterium]|nr:DUF5050 domain-containing protein [Methylophilaceae bacterium]
MSRFTSEASSLDIHTQTLVPNLHDSFVNQQMSENYRRDVMTDDHGILQGPSNTSISDKSVQSILFMGGSTTENNEVDPEYRFPFLVGKILSQGTKRFVAGINGGVRGHTSQDSLNLYLNHPSPYFKNTQYVAMMHNINDRLRLYMHDDYKSVISHARPTPQNKIRSTGAQLFLDIISWIESSSNIGYLSINTLRNLFSPSNQKIFINENMIDINAYKISEKKVKLFKQNIKNMIALTKANNQTMILITQPILKNSAAQDQLNKAVRDEALANNVVLIDLANESLKYGDFRKNIFYDDGIHFNNLGSKWAAGFIAQEIEKKTSFKNIVRGNKARTSFCPDITYKSKSLLNQASNINILNGRYPTFNSKSTKILFQTNNETGSKISILNIFGEIQDLYESDDPNLVEHPVWLDEEHILFVEKKGWDRKMFKLNIKTLTKTSIMIPNKDLQAAIPSVHKEKIYFAGYKDKETPQIYEFNHLSSQLTKLTDGPGEYWRPVTDGIKIYFINNKTGSYKIYSMRLDGGSQQVITEASLKESGHNMIEWDPQVISNKRANHLVFAGKKIDSSFNLYMAEKNLPANKSGELIEIKNSIFNIWDPSISPNEKYIAYSSESLFGDQIRVICNPLH